jgi:hypothetical protein
MHAVHYCLGIKYQTWLVSTLHLLRWCDGLQRFGGGGEWWWGSILDETAFSLLIDSVSISSSTGRGVLWGDDCGLTTTAEVDDVVVVWVDVVVASPSSSSSAATRLNFVLRFWNQTLTCFKHKILVSNYIGSFGVGDRCMKRGGDDQLAGAAEVS